MGIPAPPRPELLLFWSVCDADHWVPGDGQPQAEYWLHLLNRIHQSGKLCQLYVSALDGFRIVDELGGKGLALVINETLTPEQGKAMLDEIRLMEKAR